ncbi:hypothetical protein HHK36_026133 [Tetracentron sinense]|uniref:DNA-binding protein BIN4 n=1 Tax=Tetracentron sinense TaxID=13715 RepID=A0A834YMW0_TETSI|nr:hypothetical protein HHK36_026133 [Tetracentron sinense]
MSDSREGSPDWLRCFQAPTQPVVTLSSDSDSDSSPNNSPIKEDVKDDGVFHEEPSLPKTSQLVERKQDQVTVLIDSSGESPVSKAPKPKPPRTRLKVDDHVPVKKKKIQKHPKIEVDSGDTGNEGAEEAPEEEILEKNIEPRVSSLRLPLVLSEKVHRSKALVECEGESIDMSGDMGAVGRIIISDTPSTNHEMLFDLKGMFWLSLYGGLHLILWNVSFGQTEAKIEAVMNDFIQLKPQSNVYEAETMVEGTLDGYSFDSEDEAEKMAKAVTRQSDQNNEADEQTNGKTKGKVQKPSGVIRKKGKAGGKLRKEGRRKSQAPKKAKGGKK